MLMLKLKPTKTAVASNVGVIEDADLRGMAHTYAAAAAAVDEATAALAIERGMLEDAVTSRRMEEVRAGRVSMSDDIGLDDGLRVKVVWTERYKRISGENIEPVRDALGDAYDQLVSEEEPVALNKGVTVDDIKAVIGDEAFDLLEPLLTIKPRTMALQRGAWECVGRFFAAGDTERAEDLLMLIGATGCAPQIRSK